MWEKLIDFWNWNARIGCMIYGNNEITCGNSYSTLYHITGGGTQMGIPVKVNIDSGRKPNGVPERR